MKYFLSVLLGFLTGVALIAIGLIHNPFVTKPGVSLLSVSDSAVISLSFDRVPARSLFFSNNGKSRIAPQPRGAQEFWENSIRLSDVMLTEMHNARGDVAGLGLKFSSRSEKTRLVNGKALVDSVWYVYLPGRGSFFVQQTENYWPFITDVLIPAYRNSANNWKGTWFGDLTAGPGTLRTAIVTGGSGAFALRGPAMRAVESMSMSAYSADRGPVVAEGRLLIELPAEDTASRDDS
jgi:hypothetical protein